MNVLIQNRPATVRDYHEFRRSKEVKREPIRLRTHGVGKASFHPRGRASFLALRERLRRSAHFAQASERLDALEYDLRLRGAVLPTPDTLMQNEDCSLSLFYGGVSIRVRAEGLVWLIGGASGKPGVGPKRELLEALQLKANAQARR